MQDKEVDLSMLDNDVDLSMLDDAPTEQIEKEDKVDLSMLDEVDLSMLEEKPDEKPQEDLKAGQVAGALGIDIGGSIASQAVGVAFAPLYVPIAFGGGMASNLAGQMIAEGKEFDEVQWGRALSSGMLNLIPGAAITKFARPIVREAGKGALAGAADITIQKSIDEQRFPTAQEFALSGGLGTVLGTGAGAVTKKIADKTSDYNKIAEGVGAVYGMPLRTVDKVILQKGTKGEKVRKALEAATGETWNENRIAKQVKDFEERLILKKRENDNMKITEGWTGIGGALSELNPFLALSEPVRTAVYRFKGEFNTLDSLTRKFPKEVQEGLEGKTELNASVKKFLDGEVDELPDDLKDLGWAGNLIEYRKKENEIYESLVDILQTEGRFVGKLEGLTDAERKFFLQKVKRAIKDKKYSAKQYKALIPGAKNEITGEEYVLDTLEILKTKNFNKKTGKYESIPKGAKSLYDDLFDEIKNWQLKNNPLIKTKEEIAALKEKGEDVSKFFTREQLLGTDEKAGLIDQHLERLIQLNKGGSLQLKKVLPGNVEYKLGNHVPGAIESKWLGEVKEVGKRMEVTLNPVAKATVQFQSDRRIAQLLMDKGLISKTRTTDATDEVEAIGSFKEGFYTTPEVNSALTAAYGSNLIEESNNQVIRYVEGFLRRANALSKAVKVIFNPPSYAVNYIGANFSMAGMGIMPIVNPKYYKNLGKGFTQSRTLDKVIDFIKKPNAKQKAAIIAELEELQRYGVLDSERAASLFADDIIQAVKSGKNPFDSLYKGAVEGAGKIYSAFDVAARLTVYQHNLKYMGKIFPELASGTADQVDRFKRMAAELTNDTYQNYDRVSRIIRKLSQLGFMPQFVVFTAELTRNLFHQYRTASQMIRGTFGTQYGLTQADIGKANLNAMRGEGLKRMTMLTTLIGAGKLGADYWNRSNGISEEQENHFRKNVAYPYQVNKQLLMYRDKNDPNQIAVMNASYLMPQAIASAALEGLFSGQFDEDNPRSFFGMFAEEFVGEGTFLGKNVYAVLANRDEYGKEISLALDSQDRFYDMTQYLLRETFETGLQRELLGPESKLAQAKRGGKFTVEEVIKRQFGFRFDKIEQDKSLSFKIQDIANAQSEFKQDYTRALRQVEEGRIPAEDAQMIRARSNERLEQAHERLKEMYKESLAYSGLDSDKVTEIFTDTRANLSNENKIRVINDMDYSPIGVDLPVTQQEEYEALFGKDKDINNYTVSDIRREIYKYQSTDPLKFRRLMKRFKANLKVDSRKDLSPTEKLLLKSNSAKRAQLIVELGLNNPQDIRRLAQIRAYTPEVALQIKFMQ
jgi:hypothetical protein